MTDKFAEWQSNEDNIKDFSEYVHLNFKLIQTKMISEMRRKLEIELDHELRNTEGYVSLMVSLYGRMFNEMVYSMCGICQSTRTNFTQIVPPMTLTIVLDLMMGINPLGGEIRNDIPNDLDKFKKYYTKHVADLRKIVECLPKE